MFTCAQIPLYHFNASPRTVHYSQAAEMVQSSTVVWCCTPLATVIQNVKMRSHRQNRKSVVTEESHDTELQSG